MSMEIYVLSDLQLTSIGEWQRAIDSEGYALRLSTETSFEALNGFLPAQWREEKTGFECNHWSASELANEYPTIGRQWTHALAFRWGADLNACQAAIMAATAYARATKGIVFDPEAGVLLTPEAAAKRVRDMEKRLPEIEAALRNIAQDFEPKR
jgi:hypothetical protein